MEKEMVVTTKLEDVNSISKKLSVAVPAKILNTSVKNVIARLKNEAKLPGFRKGKIPEEMIRQRLGGEFNEELLKQVVRDTYPEAVKLSGAQPISDPNIEPQGEGIEEDKDFSYTAVFEIYPTVEATDYKGMKLEKEKIAVTKDEIEQELAGLQKQMTQLEPMPDAKLEKGILARVDFEGTADGKKFEGSEAKDFIVDIDAGNLLPEFERQLLGLHEGEESDIEIHYPDDYFNKDIAGKQGVYHVKVHELRRKVVPKLDDSFAKDLGQFKTLDDVKKVIEKRIVGAKEGNQRALLHRQVMEALSKNQNIDVPDVMVSNELGHMLEDLQHQLESQGKTLEQEKVDVDAFVKDHADEARLRVRSYLIAHAIAEKEDISVADKEIDERLASIATQSQQTEAKVKKHFEQNNMLPGLKSQMLIEKTFDFVVEKAKVKEVKPKKEKK